MTVRKEMSITAATKPSEKQIHKPTKKPLCYHNGEVLMFVDDETGVFLYLTLPPAMPHPCLAAESVSLRLKV